ncbi:MAG: hypothetical protein RL637_1116 [Pseudomonadota bacterium]|jgi:ubiquinone biosynthesis protein UbiJ
MLKSLLLSKIEIAVNSYLNLVDNSSTLLIPLSGKVIAIRILPFNEILYLKLSQFNLHCLAEYSGKVDTEFSGTLFDFAWLGLSQQPMRFIHQQQIHIQGDLEVARQFQHLFKNLQPNFEQKLAQYTGETVAHYCSQQFHQTAQWTQQFLSILSLNLSEFLQQETKDLPAKAEADIFYTQVDELRMDHDRLMARIQRLYTQLN